MASLWIELEWVPWAMAYAASELITQGIRNPHMEQHGEAFRFKQNVPGVPGMWLRYNRKHENTEWAFVDEEGRLTGQQRAYSHHWLSDDVQWRHWAGSRKDRARTTPTMWKELAASACIDWAKSVREGTETDWLKRTGVDKFVPIADTPECPLGKDGAGTALAAVEDGDAAGNDGDEAATDCEDESADESYGHAEDDESDSDL